MNNKRFYSKLPVKWNRKKVVSVLVDKPADFLILGVQPVIKASDGHHDDAFPRHVLEGSGNRDGPTLTDQIRIHVKNWRR